MPEIITQQPVELPSMALYFFRLVFSLLLIIFLTYAVLRLIKKQHDLRQKQKEWIKILDYQALGANRGIYHVEMLGVVYVLGVSEGQITILKEIDPQDDNGLIIKENFEQQEALPVGLEHRLKEGLKKFGSQGGYDPTSFKDQLEKQLNRSQRLFRQFTGGQSDEDK